MTRKKSEPGKRADKFREQARRVFEHHFGSRPRRLKPLAGGLSNFVYEAEHKEGDFIVRINPDMAALNVFIKEHWAEQAARKAGIPTAEILETGASVIPYPYAISRKVRGIAATEHPQREKIVHELGRLARKINAIRTHGFGETFDWSNNQLSRNRTLKDYLEGEYACEAKIETLERSGVCPAKTTAALRRVCREMSGLKSRPTLSHGDLRLKNVLADEAGRVTAVIDWEKATSNFAPAWELSLALHDLGIDDGQSFLEGYGLTRRKLADAIPYIKTFNMLNYAPKIERAVAEKDKPALERLRARFAGTFDLFSLA